MSVKVREPINYYTTNEDLKFTFDQMVDWEKLLSYYEEGDLDTYKMTLETAGKLAGQKIAQRLTDSDREGSHFNPQTGNIDWAKGLEQSFQELKEAGLVCLLIQEEGGPGFPMTVSTAVTEMISRADPASMTKYGLLEGVAETIERFGSEEMKAEYLPKLISGEHTASMDLTEAEAGSDLGGIATKVKEKDGKYFIEGTKTFITVCDSDVHLALVREDDTYSQTKGTTKGLSMYVVPKKLKDGTDNKVKVSKTEDKFGIKGTATGIVNYEGAQGFLVGVKGQGLKQMLRLMFGARLGVAAQAVGIAEAAYSEAREYAGVRKQFKEEIIKQPLVAEMLIEMKLNIEASRALIYDTAQAVDFERGLEKKLKARPDDENLKKELKKYRSKGRVLTTVVKYFVCEKAIQIARNALQIHGGVGYTREYLVEQFVRDSIITTIYEGTSEIQVSMAAADILRGLFNDELSEIRSYLGGVKESLTDYAKKVGRAIDRLQSSIEKLQGDFFSSGGDKYVRLRAKELSDIVADIYISYLFLKQAEKSERKETVAKIFIDKMTPRVEMKATYIESMNKSVLLNQDKIIEGRN